MKRRKQKLKFEIPAPFDWESPLFIQTSLQMLEDSAQHSLYQENTEAEQRPFAAELKAWIEKWNYSQ